MAACTDVTFRAKPMGASAACFGTLREKPADALRFVSSWTTFANELIELPEGVAQFGKSASFAKKMLGTFAIVDSAATVATDLSEGMCGRAAYDLLGATGNMSDAVDILNKHTINEAGEGLFSKGFTQGLDITTKCALAVTQGIELVYSTYKVFTVEGPGAGVLRGSLLFTIGRAISYIALAVLALLSIFSFVAVPVWAITASLASAATFQIVNTLYDRSMDIEKKCNAKNAWFNW